MQTGSDIPPFKIPACESSTSSRAPSRPPSIRYPSPEFMASSMPELGKTATNSSSSITPNLLESKSSNSDTIKKFIDRQTGKAVYYRRIEDPEEIQKAAIEYENTVLKKNSSSSTFSWWLNDFNVPLLMLSNVLSISVGLWIGGGVNDEIPSIEYSAIHSGFSNSSDENGGWFMYSLLQHIFGHGINIGSTDQLVAVSSL